MIKFHSSFYYLLSETQLSNTTTIKMFGNSLSDGTEMSLPLVSGPVVNSGDVQTDSYGSRSDASGGKVASRPKMEVVCVIDLHSHQFLSDRKRAFEEVSAAMNNVSLTHIQVSMFIPTEILTKYLFTGLFLIRIRSQV